MSNSHHYFCCRKRKIASITTHMECSFSYDIRNFKQLCFVIITFYNCLIFKTLLTLINLPYSSCFFHSLIYMHI
ncbi:hypothetical protein Hdeb2414_s1003g00971911 [Helianthus debilis subsp. tardiflorus]